ncbi:efflux RND transporter periplasmic adaptor subunit [Vibrio fluvialis]
MSNSRYSILILAILLSGCEASTEDTELNVVRPVKIMTVNIGNKTYEKKFPAKSQAGEQATLAFRVPGVISSILVNPGDVIHKGDVLAELNSDEYKLIENQANAHFLLSDVQLKRYTKLRHAQVVSEQNFEQVLANYKSAKATWEQTLVNLDYTKIIAPYDGIVSNVLPDNYEYVMAEQHIINIQKNDYLKVVFLVPDSFIDSHAIDLIKKSKVNMVFDLYPEDVFDLQFLEIDTEADPSTKSYKVTMRMDNPSNKGLLPGMVGKVSIALDENLSSALPKSSLVQTGATQSVWRVESDGVLNLIPVQLNDKGQVISGLKSGDRIVISGVSNIQASTKVREWVKERGL